MNKKEPIVVVVVDSEKALPYGPPSSSVYSLGRASEKVVMRELIGLKYSSWTEKARWALDYHQLPYRYHEYTILLGLPYLRWKLRRFWEDVSVPALIDESQTIPHRISDSWDISLYANEQNPAKELFPEDYFERIQALNELSERALCAGRGILVAKMSQYQEFLLESLPSFIPKSLRWLFLPIGKLALKYISHEFSLKKKTLEEHQSDFRNCLLEIKQAMNRGKNGYLLDRFSYADITIAVIMQYVEPVADKYIPLSPALRECWGDPQLAKDFFDLLEWRNRIYRKHRL